METSHTNTRIKAQRCRHDVSGIMRRAEPTVSLILAGHQFSGPYVDLNPVREQPGLLALFSNAAQPQLLSLMETENLKQAARFVSYDGPGTLSAAVLYTYNATREQRMALKESILRQLCADEESSRGGLNIAASCCAPFQIPVNNG